jgi:hypothetical protein
MINYKCDRCDKIETDESAKNTFGRLDMPRIGTDTRTSYLILCFDCSQAIYDGIKGYGDKPK